MNCFIQHYSPHSQLITKNCSSVSHFYNCGQIWLPSVHFLSIHLLFLHYSIAIRYSTSLPKIPNFNLVKKLADWTISAVPSISKLTECLHSSSGLLGAHGSVRHPRGWRASMQAPTHTQTQALVKSRGPIMGYCDRERLQGSQCPPRQATAHSTYCQHVHWQGEEAYDTTVWVTKARWKP